MRSKRNVKLFAILTVMALLLSLMPTALAEDGEVWVEADAGEGGDGSDEEIPEVPLTDTQEDIDLDEEETADVEEGIYLEAENDPLGEEQTDGDEADEGEGEFILFGALGSPDEVWVASDGSDESEGTTESPFATIQKGIDEVAEGGTVNVKAGTYTESVIIDKELTLKSVGGAVDTTIDADGAANAVKITANGVTVDGFTITGANSSYEGAVFLDRVKNCTIIYNIIKENYRAGIYMKQADNNTIEGNTISGNTLGIHLERASQTGKSCNDNTIKGNTIENNSSTGISLNTSYGQVNAATGNEFLDNTIIGNGNYGFNIQGGVWVANTIEGNTISGHQQYGIHNNGGAQNNTIKGNTIDDNNRGGYSGAGIQSGDGICLKNHDSFNFDETRATFGNTIESNTITNHWNGINLAGSTWFGNGDYWHYENTIKDNTISSNNGNGIVVKASINNLIEGNTITGNSRNGISFEEEDPTSSHINGASDNTVKENKIVNNATSRGYGINASEKSTGNTATLNWWGSAGGPGEDGANGVSDNVAYDPWYADEELETLGSDKPVINVTQMTTHETIQAAIDAASDGDTIQVAAGTYEENIKIAIQGITLKAVGDVTIEDVEEPEDPRWPTPDGKPSGFRVPVIDITADNVTVDGFKIRNYDIEKYTFPVVSVAANSVRVENLDFHTNKAYTGWEQPNEIEVISGSGNVIKGNKITRDHDYVKGHPCIRIASDAGNVLIEENEIYGGPIGAAVAENATVEVKNNIIDGAWQEGIWFSPVDATGAIVLKNNSINNYDKAGKNVKALKIVSRPASINNKTTSAEMLDAIHDENTDIEVEFSWAMVKDGDSIQDAINASKSGDTVWVAAGTYTENLTIDVEGLTLEGPNKGTPGDEARVGEAVIKGTVTVQANDVTVNGFKFEDFSRIPAPDWSAIYVPSGEGVNVLNNWIDGAGMDEANLTVGVHTLYNGNARVTVKNNRIENVRMGIYNQGAVMKITGNEINNIEHCAIGIDTELGTTITDNCISNCALGIELHRENRETEPEITGNTFTNNVIQVAAEPLAEDYDFFEALLEDNDFDRVSYSRYNPIVNGTYYGTIQEAINAAVNSGQPEVDVIIEPGDYIENVTIPDSNTKINLKGSAGVNWEPKDEGEPLIKIDEGASGVTIEDLEFDPDEIENNSSYVVYTDLTVGVDKETVGVGDTFEVQIDIENVSKMRSYELVIHYDPDYVKFHDLERDIGGDTISETLVEDEGEGELRIGAVLKNVANPDWEGYTGRLVTVTFLTTQPYGYEIVDEIEVFFEKIDVELVPLEPDNATKVDLNDPKLSITLSKGNNVAAYAALQRANPYSDLSAELSDPNGVAGSVTAVGSGAAGEAELVIPGVWQGDDYTLKLNADGFLEVVIKKVNVEFVGDTQVGTEEKRIKLYVGDLNDDGRINLLDVVLLAQKYGQSVTGSEGWAYYDIYSDEWIDIKDIQLLVNNYGKNTVNDATYTYKTDSPYFE